ncbi:MAG: hypothetical protein QOH93_258 [Chloroflexia bacterium]|nr:hypothetical protein [Chloroflexia bacterium]
MVVTIDHQAWDIGAACPNCKAPYSEADLLCGNCGKFLIDLKRGALTIFLLTALISLILFRLSDSIWPMYLLLILGILHLYAVIFSRGEALLRATAAFVVVTTLWGLWLLIGWLLASGRFPSAWEGLRARLSDFFSLWGFVLVVGGWLGGTLWAVSLGRNKAIPQIKVASSYFLGTGAFIFGLWATWAILLENSQVRIWLFQLVVALSLLAPLIALMVLLRRQPPDAANQIRKGEVVALWLLLTGAYLFTTDALTRLVQFGLGKLLPNILGIVATDQLSMIGLFDALKWRNPVSGTLAGIAVISLVGTSIAKTMGEFRASKREPIDMMRASINSRVALSRNEVERFILRIPGVAVDLLEITANVGEIVGQVAWQFIVLAWETLVRSFSYILRMLRYLVIPVLSFSLISVLVILILTTLRRYQLVPIFYNPAVLWAAALTVLIIILVLCGAAFGFAPSAQSKFVFAGTYIAATLGSAIYFIVSLASLSFFLMWFGFQSVGIDFRGIRPGPIYWLNAAALGVLLAILIVTTLVVYVWKWPTPAVGSGRSLLWAHLIPQALPLLVFAAVVLMLGVGFIWGSITSALR